MAIGAMGGRRCRRCGRRKELALCLNPGCPEIASACPWRDGYCCRCFEAARPNVHGGAGRSVTMGAGAVATQGRHVPTLSGQVPRVSGRVPPVSA